MTKFVNTQLKARALAEVQLLITQTFTQTQNGYEFNTKDFTNGVDLIISRYFPNADETLKTIFCEISTNMQTLYDLDIALSYEINNYQGGNANDWRNYTTLRKTNCRTTNAKR